MSVCVSAAGDVGPAIAVEGGAGQVAQGTHHGGGVVAADPAGVLGEGDVLGSVNVFSMIQWPRAQAAISGAVACPAVRSVTA